MSYTTEYICTLMGLSELAGDRPGDWQRHDTPEQREKFRKKHHPTIEEQAQAEHDSGFCDSSDCVICREEAVDNAIGQAD